MIGRHKKTSVVAWASVGNEVAARGACRDELLANGLTSCLVLGMTWAAKASRRDLDFGTGHDNFSLVQVVAKIHAFVDNNVVQHGACLEYSAGRGAVQLATIESVPHTLEHAKASLDCHTQGAVNKVEALLALSQLHR